MSTSTKKYPRPHRMTGAALALGLGLFSVFPIASSAVAAALPGTITGTVTAEDASAAPYAEAWVSDGAGNWSPASAQVAVDTSGHYSIPNLAPGSYRVGFGDSSPTPAVSPEYYSDQLSVDNGLDIAVADGATVTGIDAVLTYAGPVPTTRLAGPTRIETAVEVSKFARSAAFDPGSGVVYVANALNFPDALSAAPAAALLGGPLLLTPPDVLPAVVSDEILRLAPSRIVVVGSTTVVSAGVYDALAALIPDGTIERQGGADRYETSRIVTEKAFGISAPAASARANGVAALVPTAQAVFISSGQNYPDALSASAAAGYYYAPVLLLNGKEAAADPVTIALLHSLNATEIFLTGDASVVSAGIETSLVNEGFPVQRLAGSDRYKTSVAINALIPQSGRVYLTTGAGFADGLAGGAVAGWEGAALYVIPGTCVPVDVLKEIARLGATEIVVLGSTAVMSAEVASLTHC
ncbi:putative cell wall-binding protein [Cryobacterium sp. MP_M5]|uniref:cell wall-binding repeat-containing protein n=1 Tax=unclassified Cryobacterium TaxID=2649013 RepID=UPI0018CBCB2E|nr:MULTISPECIES: cell wall-binding repeat-containing protein [unclassified Cryobacterium]MBG6058644.1 putative cell wall-binding protein [Cryobacterium sp. MP_M3]MEC5177282.1 putative cell wall-binding protein [Cryobacterium sp. MP_M5]